MNRSIVLIGGGNLGLAIARGLQEDPPPFMEELIIVERNGERQKVIADSVEARVVADIPAVSSTELFLLAVKPADIAPLSFELREKITDRNLVVSCAAGLTLDLLSNLLGGHSLVCRVMPNLAALNRQSISAVVSSSCITPQDRKAVEELFSRIGAVIELPNEDMMHGVTALSGSGPGYLAWIADAMERTADDLGIPREISRLLVAHSFSGLGSLLVTGEITARQICEQVSSPNGTTVAAIRELSSGQVHESVQRAIMKAADRSRELSSEASRDQIATKQAV
jgi:pyrroline-5-carboxylate reductase